MAAQVNLAAAVGWLMAEAALAGDGPQDALNPQVLADLLSGTRFGQVWLVHLALAAVLLAVSINDRPRLLAVLAALNLGSLAFIGHAVLPADPLGWLHQAATVLHLLAAGFWVGGLLVILPLLSRVDGIQVLRFFSHWGHLAVALVLASGVAKSVLILTSRSAVAPAWDYATLLAVKVAATVLMLCLALINRYRHVPRLGTFDRVTALRDLRRGTVAELALAALVLSVVSLLATLSPFA